MTAAAHPVTSYNNMRRFYDGFKQITASNNGGIMQCLCVRDCVCVCVDNITQNCGQITTISGFDKKVGEA